MKRTVAITIASLALVLAAGCKKKSNNAPTAKADAAANTEPTPAPADAAASAKTNNPAMLNQMKHCPSAVEGANTAVEKTDKAVAVIINGKDQTQAKEIRERAKHMSEVAGKESPKVEHTGEGTGGGLGKCPVILTATTVKTEDTDMGVKVTITPTDPKSLEDVYEQAAARAKSLNERGGRAHGSGTGGGHGEHKGGGHGGQHKDDGAANPCGGNPCGAADKDDAKKGADKDKGGW